MCGATEKGKVSVKTAIIRDIRRYVDGRSAAIKNLAYIETSDLEKNVNKV